MGTKVLLVGIDAASNASINRLLSEEKLPNLNTLRKQGIWAELVNEGLPGAVWPSLYTGASVSRHGHYFYNQIKVGTYRMALKEEGRFPLPVFWEKLSDVGKRVAVIDAPKTRLSNSLNGIQVINWATHDPDAFSAFETYPKHLRKHIKSNYPEDPVGVNDWGGSGPGDLNRFRDSLKQNIWRRKKLILDYLNRESWDLFFAVFDDAHPVGHLAWHLHDQKHPRWKRELVNEFGDPVEDIYIEIDQALGDIISSVTGETVIIVFNSLGMGPNFHTKGLIDPFLKTIDAMDGSTKEDNLYKNLGYFWRHLPLMFHKNLWQFQLTVRESLFSKKRANRSFFPLPLNEDIGGIRLNLQGREPDGKVSPASYEAVCSRLVRELETICDSETKRKLIKKIIIPEKEMSGNRVGYLPDIIFEWDASQPYNKALWSKGEMVFRAHEFRTGSHRPEGFLVAKGINLKKGKQINRCSILDLAPTLCKLLDTATPLSESFDGRVIYDLFT